MSRLPFTIKTVRSAPKDGTHIDVWREEGGLDTVFWGFPHHECGEMGQYCDSDWHSIQAPGWVCSTFHEFLGCSFNPFTHWKPVDAGPHAHPAPASDELLKVVEHQEKLLRAICDAPQPKHLEGHVYKAIHDVNVYVAGLNAKHKGPQS